MSEVRDRMVAGAVRLLARRGLQSTSFTTVLAETGAPRGSIYHHFPGGKEELVTAAIVAAQRQVLSLIDRDMGSPAVEVARSFLQSWRALLTYAEFGAGCALVAVTVAAESENERQQAAEAFAAWRDKLASALEAGGLGGGEAVSAATLLLAASEGAVLMSRAQHDIESFDLVAAQLIDHVSALAARRQVAGQ